MEKLGRKVVAYHPEIRVRRGEQVVSIQADMDDFYDDDEVLEKLKEANPGCRTVGDLVVALEQGSGNTVRKESGVMACRISECEAATKPTTGPVRDWDEPI